MLKKLPKLLLLLGAVCFVTILAYSVVAEPWFTSRSLPPALIWITTGGALIGLITLFSLFMGRSILVFGIIFAVIISAAGALDLHRAHQDKDEPDEPLVYQLAALESGVTPEARYIELNDDMIALRNIAFRVTQVKDGKETVEKNFYPLLLVSKAKPLFDKGQKPKEFLLLVEDKQKYASLGDVNGDPQVISSIRGMLHKSRGTNLKSDVKQLFERNFPSLDWSKVYILELDAVPYGAGKADRYAAGKQFLMVGAPALIFMLLLLLVTGGNVKQKPAVDVEHDNPDGSQTDGV